MEKNPLPVNMPSNMEWSVEMNEVKEEVRIKYEIRKLGYPSLCFESAD